MRVRVRVRVCVCVCVLGGGLECVAHVPAVRAFVGHTLSRGAPASMHARCVQSMPAEEIDDCVRALTGEPLNEDALLGHEFVGALEVAQDLLGFEDY